MIEIYPPNRSSDENQMANPSQRKDYYVLTGVTVALLAAFAFGCRDYNFDEVETNQAIDVQNSSLDDAYPDRFYDEDTDTWYCKENSESEAGEELEASAVVSAGERNGGGGVSKILICHTRPKNFDLTLRIAEPGTRGHFRHGDYEGECSDLLDDVEPIVELIDENDIEDDSSDEPSDESSDDDSSSDEDSSKPIYEKCQD